MRPPTTSDQILGAVFLLLTPLVLVAQGYALNQLWLMFAVPQFNLPVPSVAQAAGLLLMTRLAIGLSGKKIAESETEFETESETDSGLTRKKKMVRDVFWAVTTPFVFLSFGYIINHWMP